MASVHGNDLKLGTTRDSSKPIMLPADQRDKHLYIAGATGTGKSKLLEYLIRQDIAANRASGCGMLVIDPHGSLYDSLMAWMARHDLRRPIIPIDMRQADWVVGYNVLRQRQANPSVVVEDFVQAMAHVWGQTGTDQTPLFARWAGNTLRALYDRGFTLADAVHLFTDQPEVRVAMTSTLKEPLCRRDWEMANSLKPKEFEDQVGSTLNRLRRFLCNEALRCIFGQEGASLDLGAAIQEGAIILVSLAREKSRVSKEDAELFATLLITDLWTAAQERGKRAGLKPFYVYLDEFQRFVTPTVAENLDEARGFGLHLTLAHQFPKQLLSAGEHGRRVYDSVMENASSKIVFRLTDPENLEPLAHSLSMGILDPDEIKYRLRSTKVMGYREEYRTAYSWSDTTGSAYGTHQGSSDAEAEGGTDQFDENSSSLGFTESSSRHFASTRGSTSSRHHAHSESESEHPVLIPVMGKELSQVQFRPLDEQLHRSMAELFGQAQRQYTARLAGMRTPVSVSTPHVEEPLIYPSRVKKWTEEQLKQLPFALPAAEALRQLQKREANFVERLLGSAGSQEAASSRRRVR